MSKAALTNLLIVVVLFAWLGSLVLGWFDHGYKMPGTVELAMASVAGYLLGQKWLRGGVTDVEKDEEVVRKQGKREERKPKQESKRWYNR